MQDDTYDGYFLPKGTKVIANLWYVRRTNGDFPKVIAEFLSGQCCKILRAMPARKYSTQLASCHRMVQKPSTILDE